MSPLSVDVLVIGAGPSGLMAAQALARLGVNVKIVDRRDVDELYGNADGIQPRTTEIWQSYGLLEKIWPETAGLHVLVGYERAANGEGIRRTKPCRDVIVNTRYPFEMTASITSIEHLLRTSLEEAGGSVTQPVLPLSIDVQLGNEKATHGVKVVLKRLHKGGDQSQIPAVNGNNVNGNNIPVANGNHIPGVNGNNGTEEHDTIFAKYVIGADGAYSWVRRELGIPMEGDQTEYVWGVMDVAIETDLPDYRCKCIIQAPTGAMIIIPREDEKTRIYVQLPHQDSVKTEDGRLDKSVLTPEIIRTKVLDRAKDGFAPYKLEFKEVFWYTIFTVSQKVAAQFVFRDRIYITGDACHTHSPKAGQGANASMGDSHNLAWKIAYVLKGWARKSLLETYEEERRTYAQDLIEFDRVIAKSLNHGTAADYQTMIHKQNLFSTGIGIRYLSRLTNSDGDRYALHLKAGERVPPSPLIRLADWCPLELQDLVISDGLFKIFVLPGDIVLPSNKSRLAQFADKLGESTYQDIMGRTPSFVIVSNSKELVTWKDVPDLFSKWKSVFVSEEGEAKGFYTSYGIAEEGTAILVRPDGYISMFVELSGEGAAKAMAYLQDL